jgi:hypothetical protein
MLLAATLNSFLKFAYGVNTVLNKMGTQVMRIITLKFGTGLVTSVFFPTRQLIF